MKLRRGGTLQFDLPLIVPLSTSHGRLASREGYLLSLMDEDGRCGFGEAAPLPEFGTEDLAASGRALADALERIVRMGTASLDDALAAAARCCPRAPCARSALDSALHDLAAQREDRPVAAWLRERAGLRGEPAARVAVQALVVGDDPVSVATSARALIDEGFGTFKLKLAVAPGQYDLGFDLERVAALRDAIGPSPRVRLDANEAWTLPEAEAALEALARFGIDFVEQPVGRDDRRALKILDEHGAIAVAADEALLGSGLEACLDSRAASTFVVKPAALGGFAPSLALFARARERDIRLVWSSLIDAAVGRAAAISLAAALGADGEVHGLGTANLLARDLADGFEPAGGAVEASTSPGLGCRIGPVWSIRQEHPDECESGTWGEAHIVESTA